MQPPAAQPAYAPQQQPSSYPTQAPSSYNQPEGGYGPSSQQYGGGYNDGGGYGASSSASAGCYDSGEQQKPPSSIYDQQRSG